MEIFPEIHSDEVQEIIGEPPHWLVRWGITSILSLILISGLISWFVRYPDVVTASFILTATDPPRKLVVRAEGKLEHLLVADGQQVIMGQPIAYLESTADHIQVQNLSKAIEKLTNTTRRDNWQLLSSFSIKPYTNIGELQNEFQNFIQQLTETKAFLDKGFYIRKRNLLLEDYNDLRRLKDNLNEQITLQRQDYELALEEFNMQEKLHKGKVISPLEFKRERAKLISREFQLKVLSSELIENKTLQTAKQKDLLELENSINSHKSNFLQALQTIRASMESWKQKYIISAPVSGKISFLAPLQEQQYLTIGQELVTIEPATSDFQGLLKIPQLNLGKLSAGQRVLVKLDGYPYREYGILEGTLSQLSLTLGRDSVYWGYVKLPNNLRTVYGRSLPYKNGLKGSAEIVTKDRRLLERLVAQLGNGGMR